MSIHVVIDGDRPALQHIREVIALRRLHLNRNE
jgi:hypothetical protein